MMRLFPRNWTYSCSCVQTAVTLEHNEQLSTKAIHPTTSLRHQCDWIKYEVVCFKLTAVEPTDFSLQQNFSLRKC